jgi:hypothetical protein
LASGPRYFITEACDIKVEIAPAMNMAGTTHARVWLITYHWRSLKASRIAFDILGLPSGRKYMTRKIPTSQYSFFKSFIFLLLYLFYNNRLLLLI